ncbi:hypothetical protein BH24ACT26_BH24ACT26_00780 [soil metagenome]
MDTDLFQTLTVALLGAIAVLLITTIATLARIGSSLRSLGEARWGNGSALAPAPEATATAPAPSSEEAPAAGSAGAPREATAQSEAEPARSEPEPARSEAEPAASEPDASSEPSSGTSRLDVVHPEVVTADEAQTAADAPWDDSGAATATPDERTDEAPTEDDWSRPERAEAEEPVGAVAASAREAEQPVDTTTSSQDFSDEPQEQPFERDGRWWFRRGAELLVYDEQTGQWLQAPGPVAGAAGRPGAQASGATEAAASAFPESQQSTETMSSSGSQEASGGFWKCPSCGAVNGSTATSCRMCFTARPA